MQHIVFSSYSSSSFPSKITEGDFSVCDCLAPVKELRKSCPGVAQVWCKLALFLLLAFMCLKEEYQDLYNPCDGMHVLHTLDPVQNCFPKELRVVTPATTQRSNY